jgi:hypothetical protein
MSRIYRAWGVDQVWLVPPSVRDFVPPGHPAHLVRAPVHGVYASRRIAKACEEGLDMMAVTGMQRPDFRTMNEFRKCHLAALAELFVQVLRLCRRAGLVKFGHAALDGTKIQRLPA